LSHLVDVQGLRFTYPPLRPEDRPTAALKDISLQVDEGESVAIMGPTGAGKSTLCMALAGLIPHATGGTIGGNVWVEGLNTKRHRPAGLFSHVGLVFQDASSQLFNSTAESEVAFGLESLGLPPSIIRERVEWALQTVRMEALSARPPYQLSGGQQKRLAIASVLAMRPPVLVLDEPSGGLDPVGKAEVVDVLRRLQQEHRCAVVLAEQDSEIVAPFVDRVLLLDHGRPLREGSPEEIFNDVETMQNLGLQCPQAAELAHQLSQSGSRTYHFISRPAAREALAPLFQRSGPIHPSPSQAPSTGPAEAAPVCHAPRIRLEAVTYTYQGDVVGVQDLHLEVPPGAYLAVVGPNGAGKSTTARLMNGLLRPTSGQVWVGKELTTDRLVGELAHQVGLCFQNPDHQIFCDTVHAELDFGLRNMGIDEAEREKRIEEALQQFGLLKEVDTPPALLGYGQRRLVTLAALYAMRPPVWVLDEPTVGLDAQTGQRLMSLVRGLNRQGHTIILITHDMRLVAAEAPRVLVLKEGAPLWDGTPRELFSRPELIEQARLALPEITALSWDLHELGMPAPVLSVPEFVERWPVERSV
jgi:energy-coupling factor transporter ATP-binding protein EcfA2